MLLLSVYGMFDDDHVLYSKTHSKEYFTGTAIMAAFCTVAITSVLDYINFFILKIEDKVYFRISFYLFISVQAIMFVTILVNVNARNIKQGYAEYDVEFKYDNKIIKTDSTIVYIGSTQNYIFLRERLTRKNYIYKTDKIDNFSIKKVAYKTSFDLLNQY